MTSRNDIVSENEKKIAKLAGDNMICVVVPVYNNGDTVGAVIEGALKYCGNVIAVDDGSDDSTPDVLNGFGDRITVLRQKRNRGKGAALSRAFAYARKKGFRTAITIDADGQHRPDELPLFIRESIAHPQAYIVGARDLRGKEINAGSTFANRFSNFWFTLHTFRRLSDTQTGYRAYPLPRLPRRLPGTSRYESELSYLVNAAWRGEEIRQLPIDVFYPPREERVTHFRPFKDFGRISLLNTVQTGLALCYGWPAIGLRNAWRGITGGETRMFTRLHGKKRDSALTLGRLLRSTYGGLFFGLYTSLIFTPFAYLYFISHKPSDRSRLFFHRMLRRGTHLILKLLPGAKFTYENPTGEDFSKPAVVICNHQSHLDLMAMISTSEKLVFLTNDREWHSLLYGLIIRRAEYLPTSRGFEAIRPQLQNLIERGYSVMIFPEGTRSPEGETARFRQGAFRLAEEMGLDIVSFAIHGAARFMSKSDIIFRHNPITLRCLGRNGAGKTGELPAVKTGAAYRRFIAEGYRSIAKEKEDTHFFYATVRYKYVWRGHQIWREAKRALLNLKKAEKNDPKALRLDSDILVLNAGIGTEAVMLALLNPQVKIYAFEADSRRAQIQKETSGLPTNLIVADEPETIDAVPYVIVRQSRDRLLYSSFNPVLLQI